MKEVSTESALAPCPPGRATPAAPPSALSLSAWCIVAAFGTYFCMYGFRKPFTAATYADLTLWGIGYKTVLVIAQTLGYTLSKFLGIKIISEMEPQQRVSWLLGLIGVAELALLLFALVPKPFNCVCLFFNGLPLGMVFGLVLGFLEGRRQTEALAAGLCVSFIMADGITKSVGAYLLKAGVSESWMPFVAGLIFLLPLLFFVWMLTRIEGPSHEDRAARSERVPMNSADRWHFFRRYALGLTLLLAVYVLITILRSIRADFAPEIWKGLGTTNQPEVFALSEIVVGIAVLLITGLTVFLRDNRRAFFTGLAVALGGVLLVALALLGIQGGRVPAFGFMVLHGLGLYLPYAVVHTTLFERLLAMTRERGNIGYLMYLADSFGYLGLAGVLLTRNSVGIHGDFLAFFILVSWIVAAACLCLLIPGWWYFARLQAR